MRQLLGVKELKSIFKLPIDDGNTIGLEIVIFRKLGISDQAEYIKYSLKNHIKVFRDEMAALNYEISEFNDEAEYIDLQQDLLKIQTRKTYAVAKKERVFSMPLYGYVYYNDLIKPSENINTSSITNALTNLLAGAGRY